MTDLTPAPGVVGRLHQPRVSDAKTPVATSDEVARAWEMVRKSEFPEVMEAAGDALVAALEAEREAHDLTIEQRDRAMESYGAERAAHAATRQALTNLVYNVRCWYGESELLDEARAALGVLPQEEGKTT